MHKVTVKACIQLNKALYHPADISRLLRISAAQECAINDAAVELRLPMDVLLDRVKQVTDDMTYDQIFKVMSGQNGG